MFKLTPNGTLTTLYSFIGTDGDSPEGLVQGTDGNFYGTASYGGAHSDGTVFRITPNGTLTTLYSFIGTDGDSPEGLAQGTDGNFYGTTYYGGTSNTCSSCGTVFKITPAGALTTLHSFNGNDGFNPQAGLVLTSEGDLYGETPYGGIGCSSPGCGTIFKITPAGTLTTFYDFCCGTNPYGSLLQATDNNFYGTTGTTVFKITLGGTFTTLHTFDYTDGYIPLGALVQGTDGNFYGTTNQGGSQTVGTVFQITPGGILTTLHSFTGYPTDGSSPGAGLVQGTDGNFYGTTESGGASGGGTVFRLSMGIVLSPTQFVPATPCRLVDSRQTHDPIQGGTWQVFIVPQLGDCNIPTTATAYSVNVTVVPHGPLGYLTVWPAGRPQPYVSTMNSPDGRIKANAAIVPAGASAAVSVYATDTTDVILDIDGYFTAPSSQTYDFYPLTPCRVVDTRSGSGFPPALGPPSLVAKQQRDLPILSSSCLNGITNPLAYSFNVTVVPSPSGQKLGYLTVWPSDQMQPTVSTLNNPTATVVANAAIVPAAPDGDIDVYAYNSTDLIIDINGYFAAPSQNGLSLYPVAPCRVLDTRNNNGKPFMDEKTVNVVGSPCAPPSNAQAYVFNATVVPPGKMPYLTLWPDGQLQPVVSTLNAYDGFVTSNMAIVPTTNGSIDAYAAGLTHLILDISGYFAP